MKKGFVALATLLMAQAAVAQDDKIITDRPSETQTPQLVAPRYLQVEAGIRKEATGPDYTLFHPRSIIRYGLSKKVELRAEVNANTERNMSENEYRYGLMPVHFGIKAALLEAHGALPQTALYATAGIPTFASKDNQVPHVTPQLRLLMENKIGKRLELDYNVGAEWEGEETSPKWLAAFEPQLSLGEKWLVFAEVYGKWQKGQGPEHVVDAGVGYYVSKNVKLDIIAGKGLSHNAPEYFISTGLSFRFKM